MVAVPHFDPAGVGEGLVMRVTLLAFALAGAATTALAAPRGLEVRDLVTLDRVSEPALSPDGRRVAYVVREVDYDANAASKSLWLMDTSGKSRARRLTAKGSSAMSPQWSADGRELYFLSSRSGTTQLWRLGLDGGEAQPVTSYALDVGSYKLAPDGRAVAFSLEVFTDCEDLACTKQRLDERAAKKSTGVLYDKLFVRHWDAWADGRRNQLFVARLDDEGTAAAKPVRISQGIDGDVPSKPFGDASEYAWSPDGRSLVFSARIAGKSEAWSTNFDLFRAPVDGSSAPVNLTRENPAWDTGPVFSADGRTLYYRAMQRPGFEADRFALMAMDAKGGTPRALAPRWDASADTIVLSPDGRRIYTTAAELGRHPLFAVDIADGEVEPIADDGSIEAFDLRGDTLLFARSRLDSPAQLFVARADGGQARAVTRLNERRLADIRFGTFEQFKFAGWNDETVHGYVVKPWNFEAGRKYPVAFIIHGGPQGSMGNNFHYRWNPQTYAGKGYAVVFIDFHGSTGYGQKFTDSISQDWGGKPLEDLQRGWAHALKSYDFLDGERACALGASYGGYMVNWIAGNWNEAWKCLVNHDGVFDTRAMGYETEELWFSEWENGGTPYDQPAAYEKFNPALHVSKWRVPMLVVQGELDFRIPTTQGLATFTALQRRGIESQLLLFPNENHWVLKPQNSVQWHDTVNAWLERHIGPK
jgi:dipeptidyl aminopeptidase/acylaminoacyl peptidase